ncbi:hypothetical protein GCM10009689_01360 [Brevibacterium antiquum]|uniref:TetR/AcrR family transcriptional regulator n=1 Tax=Brevibacterium antiquum TaxID=234835 RepID=UPI0018E01FFE|nr:TetR/AcrR family transcriptional regulator [Brevibacterium antiquum]
MSTQDPIEQLPRGIALAWGVAATPQRGPKREMSVERIVDAAIEIADHDGIQAVSMSAVAKRLGYTPMSLYRYVSAKDDLLLLMQEEATGLPPESEGVENWRTRLEELYEAQSQVYRTQPWLLSLSIMGSPITPNSSAWLDASLEALHDTPLTQDERIAVSIFVTGAARWKGAVFAGYEDQKRATGLNDSELAQQESRLFDAVITDDGYPSLRRAIDAGVFTSEADPFAFGFECGLDGLAAYIDRVRRERGEGASAAAGEIPETASEVGEPSASGATLPAEKTPDVEQSVPTDDDPEVAADKKYRESQKAVRQAQKVLAEARKRERQTLREAKDRVAKRR